MTPIPVPIFKWIDMSQAPLNTYMPVEKAFCIGRAPLKNSSRKADEKNNIYIRNPVISATHIELFRTRNKFIFLLNKSKNGFFLIDEQADVVDFLGDGDDTTWLKNGNIIGLCFSKKFLQDYKANKYLQADTVKETLKQCKILVQIFTDYDEVLVGKIYCPEDHLEGIESQIYDVVYQIGTESFKKSGMLPSAIEDIISCAEKEYGPLEIDSGEVSFQKTMFDTAIENSYDDFFDHYSDSDDDSDAGTNSDPEDESNFDLIDSASKIADESSQEETGESEELEDESEDSEDDEAKTESLMRDEHTHKSSQSPLSSDEQTASGKSLFSPSLKRSYDESNCSSAKTSDYDEEANTATEKKLLELTELCNSKSEEVEHLSEEIRRLKRSKSSAKAAILGAAGGAAVTLTALYQIGSRMNL